jgi:hypothetical protein
MGDRGLKAVTTAGGLPREFLNAIFEPSLRWLVIGLLDILPVCLRGLFLAAL